MALRWAYKIGGTGTPFTREQMDNNILCVYGELSRYGWTKEAIAGACGCFHEESGMNPGIYETSHGGNLDNLPYFPGGMGLAQWTDYPAYSGRYPNPLPFHADQEGAFWFDGGFQCWLCNKADDAAYTDMGFGQGPRWGWQQNPGVYESIAFEPYKKWTGDISQACRYWFFNFEWHASEASAISRLGPDCITDRIAWALYAYELIMGRDPEPPEPGPGPGPGPTPTAKKKKMPVWMMLRRIY